MLGTKDVYALKVRGKKDKRKQLITLNDSTIIFLYKIFVKSSFNDTKMG